MERFIQLSSIPILILLFSCSSEADQTKAFSDYPIRPVPFSDVTLSDDFWSKKIKTNHEVTIPIAVQKSEESGRIDNFKIAGGLQEGKFCSIYPFDDSDVFKIVEAASYSLQTFPDPAMEVMIDSLIDFIAAAQEPDGYLYTNRTIGKPVHEWAGDQRWQYVHDLSHELYNLGHMYEAAVAHYQATGKRSFLEVAIKSADLVDQEFGPGKLQDYPGHQEIEIGLVKLFRVTGEHRYLDLAKFFLDVRGKEGVGNPKTYDQSHIPVVDQREAVGHSVRASYMWSAMADIAAITGDTSYMTAINAIWEDVVGSKFYINGGIGATGNHEGFSVPYDLPNMSAYCETCAGVGNAIWNHRMFLMSGDSKYIDVLERSMYNNIIDGVSLSGDRFFYPNPLESYGQHQRSEWFGCACCPPNVARFLPSMPGYIYAQHENEIFVNLYISSSTTFEVEGKELSINQESKFPWQGDVSITFSNPEPIDAKLKLRVPGYAKNRPVPGGLYFYSDQEPSPIMLTLNGETQNIEIDGQGYITLAKSWSSEDQIEISFPFYGRTVQARSEVVEDQNKIAIERGPLLYCAEWADSDSKKALNLVVNPNSKWIISPSEELGGIYTISLTASEARKKLDGTVELKEEKPLKLIPYHLWNNRGSGEMRVWLPTSVESTIPTPAPTKAYRSTITASIEARSLRSIADQLLPDSSADRRSPYFHWWPKKGTTEWVQFDFDRPEDLKGLRIYWYDDGPDGGCRVPKDWKVKYKTANGTWKDVSLSKFPTGKDAWNQIGFDLIRTTSIQLEVQLQDDWAAGIHEVELL